MNKQLLQEVTELVKAGIISDDTAQRITRYYQEKQHAAPNRLTLVLSILGALLVSSGIVLIVAHNWDELPRSIKSMLSFVPLIAAQAACAYTLLKQHQNKAWKEGSSILLFFAIGASIALISQIYQVNGSLSNFLLTWVLLSLPLVYLLSSDTVALLCIAGITWHACAAGYYRYGHIPYMYAVVLLLITPHYLNRYAAKAQSNYFGWLNWFIAISVIIALGSFTNVQGSWARWIVLLYTILFCIYFFVGHSSFYKARKLTTNPYLLTGMVGILSILLYTSYNFFWKNPQRTSADEVIRDPLLYLIAVGIVVACALAYKYIRRQAGAIPNPAGFTFMILLMLLLFPLYLSAIAIFIVNVWIIAIAVFYIRLGSAKDHLGIVNFGMLIISGLAVCRFFDDNIPFVWRGAFFMIAGAGFFFANYLVLQKRKQLKKL